MTQADLEVLSGFADVWERVSGQRLGEVASEAVRWEAVLQGLLDHALGCGGLARYAAGAHRRKLLALAKEAEGIFRRLHTAYFLETGDIFLGETQAEFASYTPYNLRKLCKNAVKLAQCLQKAEREGNLPVEDAGEIVMGHENALKELLGACLR